MNQYIDLTFCMLIQTGESEFTLGIGKWACSKMGIAF